MGNSNSNILTNHDSDTLKVHRNHSLYSKQHSNYQPSRNKSLKYTKSLRSNKNVSIIPIKEDLDNNINVGLDSYIIHDLVGKEVNNTNINNMNTEPSTLHQIFPETDKSLAELSLSEKKIEEKLEDLE